MKSVQLSSHGVRHVTFSRTAGRRVLFLLHDAEDVDCLLPVLNATLGARETGWAPEALLGGWAAKNFDAGTYASQAAATPFTGWDGLSPPDVIVMSSSCSDQHLPVAARLAYPRAKTLYVEDSYGRYAKLFAAFREQRLPPLDRICCIDGGSLEMISSSRPDLDRRVYSSSQPVFEAVLKEDASVREEARRKLSLSSEGFVVCMGAPDNGTLIAELARALAEERWARQLVCTVRRHPDDLVDEAGYAEAFDRSGLTYQVTSDVGTATAVRAADFVLAEASMELTIAALRGIPAGHLHDTRYLAKPRDFRPLPHTRAHAVQVFQTVQVAAAFVRLVLDPSSDEEAARVAGLRRHLARFRDHHHRNATANILSHIREIVS